MINLYLILHFFNYFAHIISDRLCRMYAKLNFAALSFNLFAQSYSFKL
jgi:hypothetical protein